MDGNLYESASPEMLEEILREGESLLDQQLTTAIAADQRALTFAGLLVAGIGAMVGAIATMGGRASWPLVAFATLLVLAAAAALWSARPTKWRFSGNNPDNWVPDIEAGYTLHRSLAEMAVHLERAAAENKRAQDMAAWAMRVSLIVTAVALVGAIAWSWSLVLG